MGFLNWAALILGAMLIWSGVWAIWRKQADVPERYTGNSAVFLGWLWVGLGILFIWGVIFDIAWIKALFKLFLEAEN